jgi:hypothetical protein
MIHQYCYFSYYDDDLQEISQGAVLSMHLAFLLTARPGGVCATQGVSSELASLVIAAS